jgi:hypothetical protein
LLKPVAILLGVAHPFREAPKNHFPAGRRRQTKTVFGKLELPEDRGFSDGSKAEVLKC